MTAIINPGAAHRAQKVLSVAPMMAWTDRHCRYLHRLHSPNALLFTEMVTTGALLHGGQWHQLDYDPAEHPVALQLGGSEPEDLAACARRAASLGYDEINLNVGCPSERVQRGAFGACLMREPGLVADCVAAMRAASDVPVTVKCRLGVDDDDSDAFLHDFIGTVTDGGCRRFYIHARKAILGGLTPAQNRSIPPLQPARAAAVKATFPALEIIVNGGITEVAQAREHLQWADGVMIGRAAYHRPEFLSELDQEMFGSAMPAKIDVLNRYREHIVRELEAGQRLNRLTRHVLHVCNGMPGARRFRQILSDATRLKHNDVNLFDEAVAQVFQPAEETVAC